ncbi:MJ1255/VC2487 family glycosyltransferase [Bowmanella sp. JS7-9]|uniref:MJ1255/VC2487 family glycosyltransferase n=1 Tax=Pseudobowmanella zhangzhouensis TaxID=1537679 RepID=A0ABW1XRQ6_9ALTE|nr:MJ1255/VC2487 family glycosyltransferase [Bowmanella sp. JS7-9]TBX23739.1 glycosyltransferase [Bowmanella sp. JS7-9]
MNILYGVQGTGNGHITRARVLAEALSRRSDIQVDYLFSGREPQQYFDMQIFDEYQTKQGMTFVTHKGRVDRWQTARQLKLRQLIDDVQQLPMGDYDLVINDFEPISAWAAQLRHVPSISISHQACFLSPVPNIGKGMLDNLLLRYFAPTTYNLGVHWYHFGQSILPPFVTDVSQPVAPSGRILVYLPFEELNEIGALLRQFPEQGFDVFHPHLTSDTQQDNIHWYVPCKNAFKHCLQASDGVIGNAGFELSSECLHLGKKLLLKPLHGQFEQLSNVVTLEKMGRCQTMQRLDASAVRRWLTFDSVEPVRFPAKADLLVEWILDENWQDSRELCDALWQQVSFPPDVKQKLAGI